MIAKVVLGTMQNARNPGGAPANVAVAASLLFYIIHREVPSDIKLYMVRYRLPEVR